MSWSPDGTKVLFTAARNGRHANIFVISLADGKTRALTNDSQPNSEPNWSPDGRSIVFLSMRDGSRKMYLMDADGSNQRRVTDSSMDETAPRFSPDGSRLAYLSSQGAIAPRVSIVDLRSGKSRVISDNQERTIEKPPVWSPDGTRLLFTLIKGGTTHVFSIQADGSNRRQLTQSDTRNSQPQWSPDGPAHSVPGIQPESTRLSLNLMSADGSQGRKVYGGPNDVMEPAGLPTASAFSLSSSCPPGARYFPPT